MTNPKPKIVKLVGIVFFLVGWGVTIHAVARELYDKGGYAEILKLQGEWIGLVLMMVGFLIIFVIIFRLR